MIKIHDGDPDRVAIVCPGGGGYSPDWPLLYYTREVLLARGWSLRELWWTPPPEHARATGAAIPGAAAWVREQVVEALAGATLIVGKSLGTLALPVAVERSLPGIWFTPLLRESVVADALATLDAPALLVGGTSDPSWDAGVAARSGHEVYEVEGADHSMERTGDALASIDILRGVISRVDNFVNALPR